MSLKFMDCKRIIFLSLTAALLNTYYLLTHLESTQNQVRAPKYEFKDHSLPETGAKKYRNDIKRNRSKNEYFKEDHFAKNITENFSH